MAKYYEYKKELISEMINTISDYLASKYDKNTTSQRIIDTINKYTDDILSEQIYGYAIEIALIDDKENDWKKHWNYKIYKTTKIAQEAIENHKHNGFKYRIIPIYV